MFVRFVGLFSELVYRFCTFIGAFLGFFEIFVRLGQFGAVFYLFGRGIIEGCLQLYLFCVKLTDYVRRLLD